MIRFNFAYVIQHKVLIISTIDLKWDQVPYHMINVNQAGFGQPIGCLLFA